MEGWEWRMENKWEWMGATVWWTPPLHTSLKLDKHEDKQLHDAISPPTSSSIFDYWSISAGSVTSELVSVVRLLLCWFKLRVYSTEAGFLMAQSKSRSGRTRSNFPTLVSCLYLSTITWISTFNNIGSDSQQPQMHPQGRPVAPCACSCACACTRNVINENFWCISPVVGDFMHILVPLRVKPSSQRL